MASEIRYDLAALAALQDIASYIHERSPSGARNVLADIKSSIDRLAAWPNLGRALESLPLRQIITARYRYRIFYTTEGEVVTILKIYHPRQNPTET